MQANFQLLNGDSAIGGGLQLPVTQPWTADNFVSCEHWEPTVIYTTSDLTHLNPPFK